MTECVEGDGLGGGGGGGAIVGRGTEERVAKVSTT